MSSLLLQDLETKITAALAAGPDLKLDDATLGIPGLGPIVQAATGVAGLAISAASLAADDDSLTVTGTSPLLGTAPRPVTLSIRDDGGAVMQLEVSAPDAPIPLAGLAPSLLHGGFTAPARLGGIKVVSLSATLRPAAHSVTVALLATDETAIGGLLKLKGPSLTLQATGLDAPCRPCAPALDSEATIAGVAFRIKGVFGGQGGLSVEADRRVRRRDSQPPSDDPRRVPGRPARAADRPARARRRPRRRHLQPAHPIDRRLLHPARDRFAGRQRGADLGGAKRGGPERASRRDVCDRGADDRGPGPVA